MDPCRPSRYMTRIKELYTKADPVSFCKMIRAAGINNRIPNCSKLENRMILNPCRLMTLATAKAVANLANSAGCIRIPPNSNQERAPFTSRPKTSTAANRQIIKPYMTKEKAVKNLLSVNKIKKPIKKEAPIQRSCFPYFWVMSRILLWVSSYTAA